MTNPALYGALMGCVAKSRFEYGLNPRERNQMLDTAADIIRELERRDAQGALFDVQTPRSQASER